ncbi:hypothetical protein CCP3SC5AM1_150022 [Gammaproteobacteria bacterium]
MVVPSQFDLTKIKPISHYSRDLIENKPKIMRDYNSKLSPNCAKFNHRLAHTPVTSIPQTTYRGTQNFRVMNNYNIGMGIKK